MLSCLHGEWRTGLSSSKKGAVINSGRAKMFPWEDLCYEVGGIPGVATTTTPPAVEVEAATSSQSSPQPQPSLLLTIDTLRNLVLASYPSSLRLQIPRPTGGNLDMLKFPQPNPSSASTPKITVVYCNPNAGLMELNTKIGLGCGGGGGCWLDRGVDNGNDPARCARLRSLGGAWARPRLRSGAA